MALHPDIITIHSVDDLADVTAIMRRFSERGRGWINIQPDVAPDAAPSNRSALMQFFRRNSPEASLGTWLASPEPSGLQNLGVQHALGTRIGSRLDDWGCPLGDGWRRVQDSPRRGLMVEAPVDAPHEELLRWLLGVTMAATHVKTLGTWSVSVYEGRG